MGRDEHGRNVFHLLSIKGSCAGLNLEYLVKLHGIEEYLKNMLMSADLYGRIPLHYAAINNDLDVTQGLISLIKFTQSESLMLETFWIDCEGHSPLFYAVVGGHESVVLAILIINGLSVDDKLLGGLSNFCPVMKIISTS